MVLKSRGLPFAILFLSCLIVFSIVDAGLASAEGVVFSKGKIHTRNGDEDTVFVFMVTITSDGEPDAPIELVVDRTVYPMREVDPQDTNFSDGKEFQFTKKFTSGPRFFFFRCGNQSTGASTFNVDGITFLEQYHPDLVIGMILFVAPVVYFLVLLNRMKRSTITLSKELISLAGQMTGMGPGTVDTALQSSKGGRISQGGRDAKERWGEKEWSNAMEWWDEKERSNAMERWDEKESEVSLNDGRNAGMENGLKEIKKGGTVLLVFLVLGILLSVQWSDDPIWRLAGPDDGIWAGSDDGVGAGEEDEVRLGEDEFWFGPDDGVGAGENDQVWTVTYHGVRAGEEEDEEVVVTFSGEAIQPGTGHGGDTFLFTVKVTSPEEPRDPVQLIINDKPHVMKEINPDDTNFSDGKELYLRRTVDQGGWVVFFRSGNATSTTRTLGVGETRVAQYHYDVAAIIVLFIIPVIIGVGIFRQMEKEMKVISRAFTDLSNSLVERGHGK